MWLCSEHQKLPRVTVLQSADLVYCNEAERENAESVLLEELQQLQREEKQTQETEDESNVRGNIIPRDTRKDIIPRDTRKDIIPGDTHNGIHSNGNTFKLSVAQLCASSVADEVARGILRVHVLFNLYPTLARYLSILFLKILTLLACTPCFSKSNPLLVPHFVSTL